MPLVPSSVENQYKTWAYPLPIADMADAIATGAYWEIGDPMLYWPLFRPNRRGVDGLRILVAGCGTVQAAYYALKNPTWSVVGIDFSDTSLAHQLTLKERHQLDNLTLHKLDIENVALLGKEFDFITCTGVLHHLPNPEAGLRALRSVLAPNGVINLMVYGSSLRLGVYLLQEVFRELAFKQTAPDVDIVRSVIQTLPEDHVAQKYIKAVNDLSYDSGLVDTFLHPQDVAYDVKGIYELTRNCGLEFISWCDPINYSLEQHIPAEHPLWAKFNGLSAESAAHICDLLLQRQGTHRWLVGHPEYVESININFDGNDFLDFSIIPHRNLVLNRASDLTTSKPAACSRDGYHFEISAGLAQIMSLLNGENCLSTVLDEMRDEPLIKDISLEALKNEIQSLWARGHVYVLLPNKP
jgi:SAM-dependent methyltransferase